VDSNVHSGAGATLDVEDIKRLIPHRYPFLLVDRLTKIVTGESAVGIKNVTINEPFFQGHFPNQPIMPGVLIVEALAQTAGALVAHSIGAQDQGKVVYFMSIDNARFRKPVVPGDTIHLVVEKKQVRGPVWKFDGTAKVGDVVVAESTFTAMIGNP
jgi:3-hydroxyacyl-[acyl-carrier-protein] dehydratase